MTGLGHHDVMMTGLTVHAPGSSPVQAKRTTACSGSGSCPMRAAIIALAMLAAGLATPATAKQVQRHAHAASLNARAQVVAPNVAARRASAGVSNVSAPRLN